MYTLKELVKPKGYLKLSNSKNKRKFRVISQIKNILHKSLTVSRVNVYPGRKIKSNTLLFDNVNLYSFNSLIFSKNALHVYPSFFRFHCVTSV